MNYVKNEFRSLLTQMNLNACMAIALTDYSVVSLMVFVNCIAHGA